MSEPETVKGDAEAEKAFRIGGAAGLKDYAKKKLDNWKEMEVKIAVVGQSGAGKSSFINTMRGITDKKDKNYAKTGVTETTTEPKDYIFPDNPKLKMWDLPGAGTKNFKAAGYAKKMKFEEYDGFVILSSVRFTEIDKMIADEVQRIQKPFFFARTKMDNVMRDEKRVNEDEFSAEETKKTITEDCREQLEGDQETKVFLISNIPDDKLKKEFPDIQFDNDLLKQEIAENLPELQKTALVFSMTCNAPGMIALKKKEISDRFKWLALLSAAGGAVPVPGVSMAIDVPILLGEHFFQKKQLGIDDNSIFHKSKSIGLEKQVFLELVNETFKASNSKFAMLEREIFKIMFESNETTMKLAAGAVYTEMMASMQALETGTSWIPMVGSILGAAISGGSTYAVLTMMLNVHAGTAEGCITVIEDIARKTMK